MLSQKFHRLDLSNCFNARVELQGVNAFKAGGAVQYSWVKSTTSCVVDRVFVFTDHCVLREVFLTGWVVEIRVGRLEFSASKNNVI